MSPTSFRLKVRRIEQHCIFDLSWGQQELTAQIAYPASLTDRYQVWQRAYLNFYTAELRARAEQQGHLAPSLGGWRAKLVEAEAKLLAEFYEWLDSPKLSRIRQEITEAALQRLAELPANSTPLSPSREMGLNCRVDIFLTCEPLELARFPWEAWEIGSKTAVTRIRIARTPANLHSAASLRMQRDRLRLLVIVGDETGLNFQAERQQIQGFSRLAEVQFVGWQPGQHRDALMLQIQSAIVHPTGWDGLIFIGHSNETAMTGGELAIAPGESIFIREIASQLTLAKERGLQFAIFNSCSGLSLADSLINLGLSQVVVMREPIHNQVAQDFLGQFLQGLAQFLDVHDALLQACQHLKLERNLTYPSAYLIPSVFRHPQSSLFRLQPATWWFWCQQLLPDRRQGAVLAFLVLLGWFLPVQQWLLGQRGLVQAIYRQTTRQIPSAPASVLLVTIDQKSIQQAGLMTPTPMNRGYLSRLVDRLSALNAGVVGIDYVMDRYQGDPDRLLSQSLQAAIGQRGTWFVLAADRDNQWLSTLPSIASPVWTLEGHILLPQPCYIPFERSAMDGDKLPFAYLLALSYRLHQQPIATAIRPQLQDQTDLLTRVAQTWSDKQKNYQTLLPARASLHPLTRVAFDLGQVWLNPIIDFSIPPRQVYTELPAWKLLDPSTNLPDLKNRVVLIVPRYPEAGVNYPGEDNFPLSPATHYWFRRDSASQRRERFTGGESHAYIVHHFLTNWLVIPIPDIWMMTGALVCGVVLVSLRLRHPHTRSRTWVGGAIILVGLFGVITLQVYVSAAILLPWLLPAAVLLTYTLPKLLKRSTHAPI